jgi:hypothetical protein
MPRVAELSAAESSNGTMISEWEKMWKETTVAHHNFQQILHKPSMLKLYAFFSKLK